MTVQTSGRSVKILVLGLVMVSVGTCVSAVGAYCDLTGESLDYEVDWESMAIFGLSVAAVGIGLAVNSVVGGDIPLWRIRQGARSRNPGAVSMTCLGAAAASFEVGFLTLARLLEFHAGPAGAHAVAVIVSASLVVVGYFARPRSVLGMDGLQETPRRTRTTTGVLLVASGIVFQVTGLVFAGTGGETVDTLYVTWLFIIGLILELAGAGAIRPQGRPWVEGGLLD